MDEILIGRPPRGDWTSVELGTYPDGSPLVTERPLFGQRAQTTMILRASDLSQFTTAMYLVDAWAELKHRITTLIIPHVLGGRQDRLNPSGDVLFTVKSIANDINRRNFERVVLLDPHSMVTPALINNAFVPTMINLRYNYPFLFEKKWDGVISPDAGASKRALDFASHLKVPLIQGEKRRDVATGKLSGFAANGVEAGKHYLVVDDICDGGGTFNGLAEVIKAAGATADLFVTHGIFSQGTDTLLKNYDTIYTTDSTTSDKPNVTVIPIVKELSAWSL